MVQFSNTQVPQEFQSSRAGSFWLLPSVLLVAALLIALFAFFFFEAKTNRIKQNAEQLSSQAYSPSAALANTADIKKIQTKKLIRPFNPTLGNSNADVVILAFIDFECPYCAQSYPIFERVVKKYGDAIFVVFKNLPLDDIHPDARRSALAAMCAHDQNQFWPYYRSLFSTRQLLTEHLVSQARSLKLNTESFTTCLTEKTHDQNIQRDIADAISVGAQGTPTYIVNGAKISGILSEQDWDQIILSFLK
ncbi:DsbA family protein [Candidatus Nomurabacteria bacterium]|nr:DsbA family protein [Candidatus Nomurabacteria bacterium]